MADRVLVVGTTADYVALIDSQWPGRALFLTDPAERAAATEPAPDATSELTGDLTDFNAVLSALDAHRAQWDIELSGVACFDCESLALAAHIAEALGLPFASPRAVAAARDKERSKQLWAQADVPCPRAELVRSSQDAVRFLWRTGGTIVLKPLTGSGSELLFVCRNEGECDVAFEQMRCGLALRRGHRMYRRGDDSDCDPTCVVVAEEFVEGTEYSCDFTLEGEELRILRTARKIPADTGVAGITWAYVVPAQWPAVGEDTALRTLLLRGAKALGIDHAICMVDLMATARGVFLLEMTPRPGGDCLPSLLQSSGGLDILGVALDFAQGRPMAASSSDQFRPRVALKLLASASGVIRSLDTTQISDDPRVISVQLKRDAGQRVQLPPDDYDSWILGHVVFEPDGSRTIERQAEEITAKARMEIDRCAP